MGNKKSPVFCEICECNVNISKPRQLYQCVCCSVWVHKECAQNEELLAPNGSYYCFEHKNRAPRNKIRREPANTKITIENPTVEEIATSVAERIQSQVNQSLRNASLSNVINQEMLGNMANFTGSLNIPQRARMPNTARAGLGFTSKCVQCSNLITDVNKFFQCVKCQNKAHDECIIGLARMHSIDNAWACFKCMSERARKNILFNPPTELAGSEELNVQRGQFIDGMSVNDSLLMGQDELSKILSNRNLNYSDIVNQSIRLPYVNSREKSSNYAQQAATHYQNNVKFQSDANANPNKDAANEKEDYTNTLRKLTEEIEKLKLQIDAKNRSTSANDNQTAPNSAGQRTESTPINNEGLRTNTQRQHNEQMQQNDINASIQMIVEESMRRLNNESLMQLNATNQRMVEIQMNESMKNTYRVLPKVKNPDYEWIVFYQAFKESKDLFSDSENVARLQIAIECEKIKKSGGPNLFNPYTYWNTIEDLNKRIGKSENLLLNEKLKLVNNSKVRSDDKKGLIDLIEKVKKYSILVDKLGFYADKTDLSVISRLSRLLPGSLKAKWSIEFNKLRELYNVVHIQQMSTWLDDQINTCETEIYFDKMDPYGEIKTKNIKPNYESKDSKKRLKHEKIFAQIEENESEESEDSEEMEEYEDHDLMHVTQNSTKNEKIKPAVYCWFHKKSDHSVLYCFSLLNKTGKEVCQLAEKEGICTKCAGRKHANCHYNFNCVMADCEMQHALIFCHKRQSANSGRKSVNDNETKKYNKFIKLDKDQKNDNSLKQMTHSFAPSNDKENASSDDQFKENEQNDSKAETERNSNMFNALFDGNISSNNFYHWHMITERECFKIPNNIHDIEKSTDVHKVIESHGFNSLLPVVAVILRNGEKTLIGAFLLDTGSSVSIIDEHFATLLGSEGVCKPLCIEWSGGKLRGDDNSQIVQYEARGIHNNANI